MDTTFRLPRFRGQTQVSRPQQDGGEGRGRIAGGRPAQLSLLHRQLNRQATPRLVTVVKRRRDVCTVVAETFKRVIPSDLPTKEEDAFR